LASFSPSRAQKKELPRKLQPVEHADQGGTDEQTQSVAQRPVCPVADLDLFPDVGWPLWRERREVDLVPQACPRLDGEGLPERIRRGTLAKFYGNLGLLPRTFRKRTTRPPQVSTGVLAGSPESTARRFSAASIAILSLVSMEALPMCGAKTTFSSSRSLGCTFGSSS
jgi:hypothetical protein